MEYLFILIVFAAAAGSLAKGKNRNIYLWTILGALLGPFAVLAVALMKPGDGPNQGYK